MTRFAILILGLWASLAAAQTWPDYTSTTVNDYADLLDPAAEARLDARLNTLRADTGVEMTILTITRQDDYTYGTTPPPTIEDFATGVFNQWGIGNATRNDGVLILVAAADREMRIELGAGYGQDWNAFAADVLDRSFLPAFREGRFQEGIEAGTEDTINAIVMPFLAGEDAPSPGPDIGWLLVGGIAAFVLGGPLVAGARRRLARCPQCGERGQRHNTETLVRATKSQGGRKRRTVTCPHCGHHDTTEWTTSRVSSSSSSSFGGGSSGGGGATGRW
ncbi:TPM domain-containing protein [Pseudaestuariivita atlantica]|uniref:TPM domain-containing protein n=1 Tax=Pseudaestuariivita atlantica TaxID=1317121 RepID=UPI00067ACD1A|nr:TPM domain-containing protein [Pseudaestuariivita atlantica]